MRSLLWVIAIAFFFLNPAFACSADEPQYQYGANEMRAAVEGNWSFTITPSGAAATQVTVHVAQAAAAPGAARIAPGLAFMRAAYACGTRTLVKTAAACLDVSEMPLTVSFLSGDSSFAGAAMSGKLSVYGLAFTSGNLELMIGPYQVLSQLNADGSLGDTHVGSLGPAGTVTVSRS